MRTVFVVTATSCDVLFIRPTTPPSERILLLRPLNDVYLADAVRTRMRGSYTVDDITVVFQAVGELLVVVAGAPHDEGALADVVGLLVAGHLSSARQFMAPDNVARFALAVDAMDVVP